MPIKLHRDQFRWTNGRGHDQKPVLYSQKTNTHGLGKKEHNADHWWIAAFDNQLKSLDVNNSSSGEVTVKQTKTNTTPLGMAFAARYYIKFVSGGILTGDVEAVAKKEAAAVKTTEEVKVEKKLRKEKKEKKEKRSRSLRKSSVAEGKKKEKKHDLRDERKEKKRLKRLLDKEMALLQSVEA